MFSNLTQGNILYGLDTSKGIKFFTAPINSVSLPRQKFNNANFTQLPETVVDIIATVNGERKEFKQVPCNTAIADFGTGSFVLADSKDSLISYVNSMLQNSRNIVNSVDKHKTLINQYEKVLAEINPSYNNDVVVKDLQKQVGDLQLQLAEALALLKGEHKKQ